jgi:hypothetical protein
LVIDAFEGFAGDYGEWIKRHPKATPGLDTFELNEAEHWFY